MRFDDLKTETLNLRVSPAFKQTLKAVAGTESRSMVNMLEVILLDYCGRNGWPKLPKAAALESKNREKDDSK